jgi:hypothetical protein
VRINLDAIIDEDSINIEFDNKSSTIRIDKVTNGQIRGSKNSIYFLLLGDRLVYVGKTTSQRDHSTKDFDTAITVTDIPPGVDIGYLEFYFINLAGQRNLDIVNAQTPKEPNISSNDKVRSDEYAGKVLFILNSFGVEPFKRKQRRAKNKSIATIIKHEKKAHTPSPKRDLSKAEGMRFVITRGGNGALMTVQSNRVIALDGTAYVTPSAAATAALNSNANGWTEWKLASDTSKTLDSICRSDEIIVGTET